MCCWTVSCASGSRPTRSRRHCAPSSPRRSSMPTADRSLPRLAEAADGTRYRDLNGNGVMDPYEDPRLSAEERTEDLLARLSLEEKAGLLFHTVIETGPDGTLLETPGAISKSPTTTVVTEKFMTHFNVHGLESAEAAARWHNRLQELA